MPGLSMNTMMFSKVLQARSISPVTPTRPWTLRGHGCPSHDNSYQQQVAYAETNQVKSWACLGKKREPRTEPWKCLHLGDKQEEMESAKETGLVWGKIGKGVWYYATESKKDWKKGLAVDIGEPLNMETKKFLVTSKRVISMKGWSLKPEDKMIIEWLW